MNDSSSDDSSSYEEYSETLTPNMILRLIKEGVDISNFNINRSNMEETFITYPKILMFSIKYRNLRSVKYILKCNFKYNRNDFLIKHLI